jgi:RNA recognition motif-containing protein
MAKSGDSECMSAKMIEIPVKLFVGRFPHHMTEEELCGLFTPFGEVKECKILSDYITRESKGCAFVKYSNLMNAIDCIRKLDSQYIVDESVGGPIQVQFANGEMERLGLSPDQVNPPPTKVFVGSIPASLTKEKLRSIFEEFGDVVETFILSNGCAPSLTNGPVLGSVCL